MRKLLTILVAAALAVPVVAAAAPSIAAESAGFPEGSFDDAVATRPQFTANGSERPATRTEAVRASSPPRAQGASLAQRGEAAPELRAAPGTELRAEGFAGQGVRVGIIDFFDPAVLNTQINAGLLPSIPNDRRRCFTGTTTCPFGAPGDTHGNAIAEIVSAYAPSAELFLAEVGGLNGYYAAIDWFAANNIKVLNHSLIGAYDGPGDGTGPQAAIVDYAVSKGMSWFNSAGDGAPEVPGKYRGGYWRGTWNDPNGNGFLNFSGTDENLGVYCGALLGLRWSDWGASRTDYELWIGDFNYSSGYATASIASDNNQAIGAAPLEGNDFRWLCNTSSANGPVYDKNKDGFVNIKVKRSKRSTAASSAGDIMEIQVINGWFEHNTGPGSSAIGFADSKNLAAASIGYGGLSSALGPTNDGRYKPDLMATGCFPTSVYGGCDDPNDRYTATDVAAAIASGTAATFLSAFGPMEPWQVVQWFRNYAAPPWSGFNPLWVWPNHLEGYGWIRTTTPGTPSTAPNRFVSSSRRILDTRVASNVRNTTAPVSPNSAINMKIPAEPYGGFMPAGTTVVLNITIVKATGPGYVQVGPNGWTIPGTSSNLNVERAGQTIANVVVTPLGVDDAITIYVRGGGHVLVDLVGYFGLNQTFQAPPPGGFVPLQPYRAYDSRCVTCGALAANTSRDIQITGTGVEFDPTAGIDSTAVNVSAVVSVTADTPGANGFMSAVATYVSPPMPTSTTNFSAGLSATGLAIASVSADGKIRIYSSVATHFQVDVLGYFASGTVGGDFIPVTPFRALDTRLPAGSQRPAAGAVSTPTVATNGIPADAAAVIGNLTTTGANSAGELRIGADAAAAGGTYRNSSVAAPGQIVATAVTTAVDHGSVAIVATPSAHRLLDISGYFTPVVRATNADIVAFPEDASFPARFTVNPVMSPDGTLVAAVQSPPLTPGVFSRNYLRLWDRTTDTLTTLDITVDDEQPNGQFTLTRISPDNQRLLFRSTASNITADDTSTDEDWFILDLLDLSVRRVNELPDGTRVSGGWFNLDLTRMAFTSFDLVDLLPEDTDGSLDTYVIDLETNTVSFMIDNNGVFQSVSGFNRDLTLASIGGNYWRPGQPLVAVTNQWATSMSDDGRYLLYQVELPFQNRSIRVFDFDTGTSTTLCDTSGWASYFTAVIDWSSGPPQAGTWCQGTNSSQVQLIDGTGQRGIAGSWTGLPLRSANGQTVYLSASDVHDGRVALISNAINVLPGFHPTDFWVFIYDPT